MKNIFILIHLAAASCVLYGLFSGQPAVALLGFIALIGAMAFRSISQSGKRRLKAISLEESSSVLRPFLTIRDEIAAIAESTSTSPEARHIAQESLKEADTLIEHARHFGWTRASKRNAERSRKHAVNELALLNNRIQLSESDEQRDSLALGVLARENEIKHYMIAEQSISEGWGQLEEAMASLVEIKARLATGSIQDSTEITGMVDRIKTLSKSFDEAVESVQLGPS